MTNTSHKILGFFVNILEIGIIPWNHTFLTSDSFVQRTAEAEPGNRNSKMSKNKKIKAKFVTCWTKLLTEERKKTNQARLLWRETGKVFRVFLCQFWNKWPELFWFWRHVTKQNKKSRSKAAMFFCSAHIVLFQQNVNILCKNTSNRVFYSYPKFSFYYTGNLVYHHCCFYFQHFTSILTMSEHVYEVPNDGYLATTGPGRNSAAQVSSVVPTESHSVAYMNQSLNGKLNIYAQNTEITGTDIQPLSIQG